MTLTRALWQIILYFGGDMNYRHGANKQKPWSKLQREIYKLISPELDFQIHCAAYRMDSNRGSTDLPRYWITLNKEIIFDYPKNFLSLPIFESSDGESSIKDTLQGIYPYGSDISEISSVICEYIDTPKELLFAKVFENDKWGLTDMLKSADRRIGKRKLLELGEKQSVNAVIAKIIAERMKKEIP
ncbi:hypothetical protein AGMMS49928_25400 [Spirochaetia bacterium]|nr:hypothetical protein AGMMS49928_25400 [Spirochaetia bacterium]